MDFCSRISATAINYKRGTKPVMAHYRKYIALCAVCIAGYATPALLSAQSEVVAQQDMATMANALEVCVIDTGYYVSLENLNDVSAAPGATRPFDSIQHLGGVYVMLPDVGTFQANRRNLATAFNPWGGPYVTYQTNRIQTGTTPYDEGSLLDPWGSPYYLFNPLGLIRGDSGTITLELYGDQFDRYTIVSLGPDGVMSADDIIRPFNGTINGTRLTSLKGPGVTRISPVQDVPTYEVEAGTTLTLRGFNFGSESPNKSVVFNSQAIPHTSWTNREIQVLVPQELSGTGNFQIAINSGRTNVLQATITDGDTAVHDWKAYE